jgi:RND family efflux transporter MFP subunit
MPRVVPYCVIVSAVLLAAGCGGEGKKSPAKAEMPPPWVTVDHPVSKPIRRYETATGRVEPVEQVEIRARVNGYLTEIHFKPGQEIEAGKPMFLIDPEPYKADLAKAKAILATAQADLATSNADLVRAEARLAFTKNEYDRFRVAGSGASTSEVDKAKSNLDEADAATKAAKARIQVSEAKIEDARADVRNAELNLGFCSINAPISGICGDTLVTKGNLVTGGTTNATQLTTIVSADVMDIGFDLDENTYQRIQRAVRDGSIKTQAAGAVPAEAGLAIDGTAYPLKGFINFLDNKLDPKTGTLHIKARFDNPKPPTGQRLLAAGMYARIRVPMGEPVERMLLPDSAISSDQGIPFLYLVGSGNKAIRCDAATAQLEGGYRVVESIRVPGEANPRPLTTEDTVVVTGLQRVRDGLVVDPKPLPK